MPRPNPKSRGFTILEIVLIIFALFILALATLPKFTRANSTTAVGQAMKHVQNGCETVKDFVASCAKHVLP